MPENRPRLRVLISNTIRLWAGAERFALDAARGLQERQHRVLLEGYPGEELERRAEAAGIAVRSTRVHGDGAPWVLGPLTARLRRDPVDVVWTMREKDLRNIGLAARLAQRGIAVVHSRECDEPIKSKLYNRWIHLGVPDRIVVNSEATRRTSQDSAPWLPADRFDLLPKGIDLEPWLEAEPRDWPARMGRRADEVVIGFAGQLVSRKRLDLVMRVLAEAPLRSRRWRLVVAGRGPEEAALQALAEELGIAERVVFCGFVEALPPWMVSLDVFVLPSKVEGFGYVVAEAMASGIPVLGFAASSVPEVVTHGQSGLLSGPDDVEGFARNLLQVVEDPTLRASMGQKGREEAIRRHSLERMLDTMESILYRARGAREGRTSR